MLAFLFSLDSKFSFGIFPNSELSHSFFPIGEGAVVVGERDTHSTELADCKVFLCIIVYDFVKLSFGDTAPVVIPKSLDNLLLSTLIHDILLYVNMLLFVIKPSLTGGLYCYAGMARRANWSARSFIGSPA